MDATIIYLKDKPESGKVEVSVEIIGDPRQAFLLADAIMERLKETKDTIFVISNEFVVPPSNRLQ